MVDVTMVNICKIKSMELVNLVGLMEGDMPDNGLMGNNMVKVFTLVIKEKLFKVNGAMVKELNEIL